MLGYMSENILSGECDVVEPGEVADLVAAGWTLLDVRTPDEFRAGTIPGAVTAPLDDLRDDLASLGTGPFLVFCQVGQRGHTATELLHELGVEGPQPRRRDHHLACRRGGPDRVGPGAGHASFVKSRCTSSRG